MAINVLQRSYNLLDADLCMFVSNLCNTLTRDLSDLSILGLSVLKIASFKALGDAFEILSPDATYIGDIMIATENKKAIRDNVLETIKIMALRVETKWGLNSGKYKRLNLTAPSQLTDDLLLTTSRDMQIKVTEYLSDLVDFGLTQIMLDNWEDLNNQFELARNAQADAISNRDEKTQDRIAKGNELYSWVVTYCNFGKRIYENTNAAKYNDYVIYTPGPGSITAPVGLNYNPANKTISWTVVENATSYQVQISSDSVDFNEIYAGAANSFVYSTPITSLKYLQCRARNANGYGKMSEMVEVA
jgi:hypothetical protein